MCHVVSVSALAPESLWRSPWPGNPDVEPSSTRLTSTERRTVLAALNASVVGPRVHDSSLCRCAGPVDEPDLALSPTSDGP